MSSKETAVETAKRNSNYLRGTIDEALHNQDDGFVTSDTQILKFHGIYQQEDRDLRSIARAIGSESKKSLMVRIKVPGGVLTAEQYLAMDQLSDEVVYNHSLRITNRQNFQLHGVLKQDLHRTIARINQVMLTTFSGCGPCMARHAWRGSTEKVRNSPRRGST